MRVYDTPIEREKSISVQLLAVCETQYLMAITVSRYKHKPSVLFNLRGVHTVICVNDTSRAVLCTCTAEHGSSAPAGWCQFKND